MTEPAPRTLTAAEMADRMGITVADLKAEVAAADERAVTNKPTRSQRRGIARAQRRKGRPRRRSR